MASKLLKKLAEAPKKVRRGERANSQWVIAERVERVRGWMIAGHGTAAIIRLARNGEPATGFSGWPCDPRTVERYIATARAQLREEARDRTEIAREAWLERNHDHVQAMRQEKQWGGLAAIEANLAKVQGLMEHTQRHEVSAAVHVTRSIDLTRLTEAELAAYETLAAALARPKALLEAPADEPDSDDD